MTEKKWYAVYTMPRWEKKVAERFDRAKIEHYCPLNRVVKQWADRKKTVFEPLFTSYVFVKISDGEQLSIRKTDGIINFVYWLGKPAVIKPSEIDVIRRFLDEYSNVKLEKTNVCLNDTVRVVGGPFMDQEGQVISIKNRFVRVLLPSLGYMMSAEIEIGKVELIRERIVQPQHKQIKA